MLSFPRHTSPSRRALGKACLPSDEAGPQENPAEGRTLDLRWGQIRHAIRDISHRLTGRPYKANPSPKLIYGTEHRKGLSDECYFPAIQQKTEELYRSLVESIHEIVFTLDIRGNFTFINRAGEELFGYSRSEITGMSAFQLFSSEFRTLFHKFVSGATACGGALIHEALIFTKNGGNVPLKISAQLVSENGKPLTIQVIGWNISEEPTGDPQYHINNVLEDELQRIAHALHDESGQMLAAVHLALHELASNVPATAISRVNKIAELLYHIEDQLREFSHELCPTVLNDRGLEAAVQFLASNASHRAQITIETYCEHLECLSVELEIAIYRTVQEALTNIIRHSKATRADIHIFRENNVIRGSIQDNGIGFDISTVFGKSGRRGLGLLSMETRIKASQGTFSFVSCPGKGTELLFTFPLAGKDVYQDIAS
jgi:PAS domain S-box-containing protein